MPFSAIAPVPIWRSWNLSPSGNVTSWPIAASTASPAAGSDGAFCSVAVDALPPSPPEGTTRAVVALLEDACSLVPVCWHPSVAISAIAADQRKNWNIDGLLGVFGGATTSGRRDPARCHNRRRAASPRSTAPAANLLDVPGRGRPAAKLLAVPFTLRWSPCS